jgi:predicted transcriptional regulator
MTIQLTPGMEIIVGTLLKSGNYADQQVLFDEALRLLQRRDELRAEMQEGLAQLARGESLSEDEVFGELEERIDQLTGNDQ